MRPSARQLIEGIDWSIQQRVVTATEDKWAASTLRSVHCLLQHLAVRVEQEGELLHNDNSDLRDALSQTQTLLGTSVQWGEVCAVVSAELKLSWRSPSDYPSVKSLTAENEALRAAVDQLVRDLHPASREAPDGVEARALAVLDGYLERRLLREQPLFVPAFLSSTF